MKKSRYVWAPTCILDFKTTRSHSSARRKEGHLCCYYDAIELNGSWRYCWRRQCIAPMHGLSASIHVLFCLILLLFHISCYKGDSGWVSEHCRDQKYLGLCLGCVPATARARSLNKAKPCAPPISTMHRQQFLIRLFNKTPRFTFKQRRKSVR